MKAHIIFTHKEYFLLIQLLCYVNDDVSIYVIYFYSCALCRKVGSKPEQALAFITNMDNAWMGMLSRAVSGISGSRIPDNRLGNLGSGT